MDSPVWVLVGFRVNVGFGAWKFNCRKVRGLLLRLNMHTAHQRALDRQTITKTSDSEGIAEQSAASVKRVFTQENASQMGSKDLSNPCMVLLWVCQLPFTSPKLRLPHWRIICLITHVTYDTYHAWWFYDIWYHSIFKIQQHLDIFFMEAKKCCNNLNFTSSRKPHCEIQPLLNTLLL